MVQGQEFRGASFQFAFSRSAVLCAKRPARRSLALRAVGVMQRSFVVILCCICGSPATAGEAFSCDWTELTLEWPLTVYGNAFYYPNFYVAIDTDELGKPIDHEGNAGHNGIDIGTPSFGPTLKETAVVHAAADGRIVAWRDGLTDRVNGNADWLEQFTPKALRAVTEIVPDIAGFGIEDELDGSGNVVYLQHPNGFVTQYAHLAEGIPIMQTHSLGDWIEAGTTIGILASSGASGGPHLHFGIHSGPQCKQVFDAAPELADRIGIIWSSWGYLISPDVEEEGSGERMWVEGVPRWYNPRFSGQADKDTAEVVISAADHVHEFDNPPAQFRLIPADTAIRLEHRVFGSRGDASLEVIRTSDSRVIIPRGDGQVLVDGQSMSPEQLLKSANDRFLAQLNDDGRLCVSEFSMLGMDNVQTRFCTPSLNGAAAAYELQAREGNLCIVDASEPNAEGLWCAVSETVAGQSFVTMQTDGNLCLYQGRPQTPGNFIWCSFSQVPPDQRGPLRLNLPEGEYRVRAHRRADEGPWQMRNEQVIQVRETDVIDVDMEWTGNSQGLTLGDLSDGSIETPLEIQAAFPSLSPDRLVLAIELEVRLADPAFQGINPFNREWGATTHLEVLQGSVRLGELSPGVQPGEWMKGWLLLTDRQGLSSEPLRLRFDVPNNGNGQSDFIRIDEGRMRVHSIDFDSILRDRFEVN